MRYRFMRFPEGKTKAVTLSYDDGCRDDIRLSKIMNQYGIKCTFNINSGMLGESCEDWHLTKEEIDKYLIGTGHEIAVHGEVHKAPGIVTPIEGIQDVLNCRLTLEKIYGQIIRGMAYPDTGVYRLDNQISYDNIKRYLIDLGIVYARSLAGDNDSFALPHDWHAWVPTAHHKNSKIMEYIDAFLNLDINNHYCATRQPRLFYLWGHSYEFDQDNNWELFETICEKLGGKKEIWYATNIEIYDYVKAYHALVYSADGTMVCNPTLYTIWFDIDGTLYKINPGETIDIHS